MKQDESLFILSEKLRTLRKIEGYSQSTVCKKLGISRQGYQHYESAIRMPTMENLKKIAALYHLPVLDLLRDEIELSASDFLGSTPIYGQLQMQSEESMLSLFRQLTPEQKRRILTYTISISFSTQ